MTDICHKCKRPIGDAMSISYVGAGVGHFYSADCYRALDAEISLLTAELAAARKPQGLTELLGELRSAVTYMRDAVVAVRRYEGSALADQYLLRAEEIAAVIAKADGAQDGGEGKASTCSRWVHGDCMCVKPPGHDGRCDCACYITEDPT